MPKALFTRRACPLKPLNTQEITSNEKLCLSMRSFLVPTEGKDFHCLSLQNPEIGLVVSYPLDSAN
jgi:hypothetical protein